VPTAYPLEFRRDVVAVALRRQAPMSEIAKDFGISEVLPAPLGQAGRDRGRRAGRRTIPSQVRTPKRPPKPSQLGPACSSAAGDMECFAPAVLLPLAPGGCPGFAAVPSAALSLRAARLSCTTLTRKLRQRTKRDTYGRASGACV